MPAALLLAFCIGIVIVYADTKVVLPQGLPDARPAVVTMSDGSPLGTLEGAQHRIEVPLAQVPQAVQEAVLAAEDRHYYSEPGISIPGIARAAFLDVIHHRLEAGGSTITQQYVKNAYLSDERTFGRKLREAVLAVKIDQRYSKDEVLGFYLNTIYFGRGAYGIEAASQAYFGADVTHLGVAQGAVLAASIQAPERLDPSINPGLARARWHYVLDGMVKDGVLPAGQAAAMTYPPVSPRNAGSQGLSGQSGYLLDMVRAELEARGFSAAQVYGAGLHVRTTFVPQAETAAVAADSGVLRSPGDPQSALVAVQPGTGRIVAAYGGQDYATRPFDNATEALRQPGSSFKPFVLAAALSKGISLRSTFNGASPQTFPGYGQPVTNFDGEQFGMVDLVTATANSVNTVYVPLAQRAGLSSVIDAARAAGIPDHDPHNGLQSAVNLQPDPSLALGAFEVHPIDMASAYATLAARGVEATPFVVDKVTNAAGKVVYRSSVQAHQAIDRSVVADVTFALEHVISQGTGNPEAVLAGGRPAAGKTGTSSNSRDAWFVGYTPSLAAAVWMGYDPKTPQDKVTLDHVEGVTTVVGGSLPARIWKRFMDAALAGTPAQDFPPPAYVGAPPTTTSTPPATPPSFTPVTGFTVPPTSEVPTVPPYTYVAPSTTVAPYATVPPTYATVPPTSPTVPPTNPPPGASTTTSQPLG